MKETMKTLLLGAIALTTLCFISCDDDDLGPTIFDTNEYPLDRSAYTFPLDTFLKVNYLEPYNMRFIYRMEDIGSDMTKNLTPASYEKSVELAVLLKYLWIGVYEKYSAPEFLKVNAPRIIHVIGSKNLNPSQGTEVLGEAGGGLKISLFNTNNLNVADVGMLNEYFIKTIHHEFGHILDQTHIRPTSFNLISRSQYDASTWTQTPDSMAAGRGFVSPYASSAPGEDWVEVLAMYITQDSVSWNQLLGSASYEWEEVDMERSDYEKRMRNANLDTVGYYRESDGAGKVYRRACKRNADDYVALDENGEVQWLHTTGIEGDKIIMQKVGLVRDWLKDNWNIDLDNLRKEVQQRMYLTNDDGTFQLDRYGRVINRLTSPSPEDPSIRFIDQLMNEVYAYKLLQQ
ncbi:MAG: hypothetical protein J5529_05195 [Prevotella sp.]|nr:hypothetical protein [Prevotella sp.]